MMIKLAALSLAAAVALSASSVFAATNKTCCASEAGKMECAEIYANLKLTPEQKAKLDPLQARCEKDACTEDSMKKYMKAAKKVLSAEQYAQLKAECSKMEKKPYAAGS
ncbi:MAG: hypothetical protein ABI787_08710 [Spartobacteria bacterium]